MSSLRRLYRGENDIDFVKWWRRGLILSAVLIVISVVSLFTRGLNLGIDFEGGVSWEVKAPGASVVGRPRRARRRRRGPVQDPDRRHRHPPGAGHRLQRRQAGGGAPGARRPGQDRHLRGHGQHRRPVVGQGDHQVGRARPGRLPRRHPALPVDPPRVEDGGRRGAGHGPRRRHQRRRLLGLPARGDPADGDRLPDHPRLLDLRHHRRVRQGEGEPGAAGAGHAA